MSLAIETAGLTKRFEPPQGWRRRIARVRPVTAVRDVDLAVPEGELFGLLGPNGAGKTTLVKLLCTLILPTTGRATVAGHPLQDGAAIRAAVGLAVSDERSFYWRLSARQNLTFFAALYGLYGRAAAQRVDELLREVDLLERADDRFSNYSTGMRQRLAIARSLIHRPRILFLDEPSRSLDPAATARLHDLIGRLLARQQVTIFLITHDLAEAEKLCDRVAVMHRGEIQAVGRPVSLRQQLARRLHYRLRVDHLPEGAAEALCRLLPDLAREEAAGHLEVTFSASETAGELTAALDCLRQAGVHIYSIEGSPPTLEEVFAHYTQDSRVSGKP